MCELEGWGKKGLEQTVGEQTRHCEQRWMWELVAERGKEVAQPEVPEGGLPPRHEPMGLEERQIRVGEGWTQTEAARFAPEGRQPPG